MGLTNEKNLDRKSPIGTLACSPTEAGVGKTLGLRGDKKCLISQSPVERRESKGAGKNKEKRSSRPIVSRSHARGQSAVEREANQEGKRWTRRGAEPGGTDYLRKPRGESR